MVRPCRRGSTMTRASSCSDLLENVTRKEEKSIETSKNDADCSQAVLRTALRLPDCHRDHITNAHMKRMQIFGTQSNKNTSAYHRLMKELKELMKNPPEYCSAAPTDSNFLYWRATIMGPPGSPYENGIFHLEMDFPDKYPFAPPTVRFLTRIYHCNVGKMGNICLDILNSKWTPALCIEKILLSITSLIVDPNPCDPMRTQMAAIYLINRERHDRTARLWTRRYAMRKDDQIKEKSESQQNHIPSPMRELWNA
ncbi:ubiquitin-conjugating enzyme E2 D2B-like [Scaptodrosophila lebanonensis]|uniref:E2 ubiquitin-conjugating enzyme n=1 Tax=Drosophila lebanonensis TaxID=7225 RepID=A0A6J2UEM7_DROLE|nr:ubiquitin-conjugating enzyme E2 D2B-like [Scaptodrosophila lebanonensis]XP_030385582.1 ubiquitin-conjugating enzyme E2 D2B-like [Scaptodrosophila lebanonensis]